MSGASREPAVLLMAAAAPAGLRARLGEAPADAVRKLLDARAAAWAAAIAGDRVMGAAPDEALPEAAARAFDRYADRPLLIAWPALARWRPDHATAALEDLAEGCAVAIGPVFDGGFYLVALARPAADLLDLPSGPDSLGRAFAAAHAAELEVGMLRAERGLRTSADVAAALADPLLDAELRELLS